MLGEFALTKESGQELASCKAIYLEDKRGGERLETGPERIFENLEMLSYMGT